MLRRYWDSEEVDDFDLTECMVDTDGVWDSLEPNGLDLGYPCLGPENFLAG